MRLAVAIGVIAVTLAAALYVHERTVPVYTIFPGACRSEYSTPIPSATNAVDCTMAIGIWTPARQTVSGERHPKWQDPVAVLLALGGVAVAVGIVKR